jgi:hypothetical protein
MNGVERTGQGPILAALSQSADVLASDTGLQNICCIYFG